MLVGWLYDNNETPEKIGELRQVKRLFLKVCGILWPFIDHYTHLNEIVRHQLSYMQLYNTQHAYNLFLCYVKPALYAKEGVMQEKFEILKNYLEKN